MSVRDFFRLDDRHPFTGAHMLAVTLAFFGVIVLVNLVMTFAATGTFPGLIVKNSYVASQNYNRLKASALALPGAGWDLRISAPQGRLSVKLAGPDGTPRHDLDVRVLAGRPSSARDDRTLRLAEHADGYRTADKLSPGQWLLEVAAWREGNLVFRAQRRIHVEDD